MGSATTPLTKIQVGASENRTTTRSHGSFLWFLIPHLICQEDLQMAIWLVVEPPLWKIWVRQLGWWHSQLNAKIKFMFQTTNQQWFCISSFSPIHFAHVRNCNSNCRTKIIPKQVLQNGKATYNDNVGTPSPKSQFYRWYVCHSQSWVVYGIVWPTSTRH